MQDDIKSLSHSKWRCKYHIVFALKYRRQEIYGKIKADMGQRMTACLNAVSGHDWHHGKVDGTTAGLGRGPFPAGDILCRQDSRITGPCHPVKDKVHSLTAVLDMPPGSG